MTLSVGNKLAKVIAIEGATPATWGLITGEQQHVFEVKRFDYVANYTGKPQFLALIEEVE